MAAARCKQSGTLSLKPEAARWRRTFTYGRRQRQDPDVRIREECLIVGHDRDISIGQGLGEAFRPS